MMYIGYYQYGPIHIQLKADRQYLLQVSFIVKEEEQSFENDIIKETKKQLSEYFFHQRKEFVIPISFQHGTPFQKKVWETLPLIPYGTTVSYQYIADQIGKSKAVRAVANAIGKNPLAIILPCHRVIGKDQKLHGFTGGVDKKIFLLQLERKNQK